MSIFDQNSRYDEENISIVSASMTRLNRRFLSDDTEKNLTKTIQSKPDTRIDQLGYQESGDPLLYWQIADANRILHPQELRLDKIKIGIMANNI